MEDPILLTDAQIQRFICDGFLAFNPSVPEGLHETIDQKFRWIAENEYNPGNNISARVQEIQQIVDSPEVKGALLSLLGHDYFMIPHRFWHKPEPRKEEMETLTQERFKEIVGGNSHQDNYSPPSPGRSHGLQYLRVMYYSHPMELINGPTHVTPGSQYNGDVEDEDRAREQPVLGAAGTVFISHFDLIHAGSPNQSDRVRNMLKLLFAKATEPGSPTWKHECPEWKTPSDHQAPYLIENLWRQQWRWLSGANCEKENQVEGSFLEPDQWASMETSAKVKYIQELSLNSECIPFLIDQLNTSHQAVRSSSIYALGEIGGAAIDPLVRKLLEAEEPEDKMTDLVGGGFSMDDEAYALTACGEDALRGAARVIGSNRPWSQVNGLQVVIDLGVANEEILTGIEACLQSDSDQVVSFACLALGRVGDERSLPLLLKVLKTKYDTEHHQQKLEINKHNIWPIEYAIHFQAAFSLVRLSKYAAPYEDEILEHLHHPFGQVSMMAGECLKRIGSASAMKSLVEFLEVRRWDASLTSQRSF